MTIVNCSCSCNRNFNNRMNGQIFLIVALLVCTSVQLVISLRCLTCGSGSYSCLNPRLVTCNASTANNTRNILNRYYHNLQLINDKYPEFSCFYANYKKKNITALQVAGCIISGTVSCESQLIDETLIEDKCNVCDWDLCNSFEIEVPPLECYTCFGPAECKSPKKVGCNANATSNMREMLNRYYNNDDILRFYGSYGYNCFVGRYVSGNQTDIDLRGCIDEEPIKCNARLKEDKTMQYCSVCNTNLCNTKSVAAISSSIGRRLILLVIAKMFLI